MHSESVIRMPDPVFGEKVCVYVVLKEHSSLSLDELAHFMRREGYSREYSPERLLLVDELPIASGGKVAKQKLREDIRLRLEMRT